MMIIMTTMVNRRERMVVVNMYEKLWWKWAKW